MIRLLVNEHLLSIVFLLGSLVRSFAAPPPAPDWTMDGKFGIFIHWGLYAVPAAGREWYPRTMYNRGDPLFEHRCIPFCDGTVVRENRPVCESLIVFKGLI